MGGLGSGRWFHWDTRTTLETLGRLDVRWLQRHGYLDGEAHWYLWGYGARLRASVDLTVVDRRLVIDAGQREDTHAVVPVQSTIPLVWTPCNYGGRRPWFRCPQCFRRVAVLWGRDLTAMWCRHCVQLPYASQQATAHDRRYRTLRKLRARLGASPNLIDSIRPSTKPKGMHWRTWARLRVQAEEVHGRILQEYEGWLAMRLGPLRGGTARHAGE